MTTIGPIRHLVAPNSGHWTMLEDWQKAVPEALTWAAPGLRERWPVKRSGLRLDRDLGGHAVDWPAAIDQIDVEGVGGFHETCLFHKPSRTLVLTDLIHNLDRTKMPLASRPFLSLAGNAGPEARAPGYLRAAVRLKGKPPREAAARLVALAPERVIFSHGEWFDRNGTERLRQALDWLLDS